MFRKSKFFLSLLVASFILTLSSCIPDDLFNTDPDVIYIEPMDNTKTYLSIGDTLQLDWVYVTSDSYTDSYYYYGDQISVTRQYSWFSVSSTNTSVCTVTSDGYLTAVGPGITLIQISAKKGPADPIFYDITVSSGDSNGSTNTVTSISLGTTSKKMMPGDTDSIYFRIDPYYATNTAVTCSSSDEDVVTASVQGNYLYLTAIANGTATVTLTSVDSPSVKAYCKITVSDGYNPTYSVQSLSISEEYLYLDIGESSSLFVSPIPSSAPGDVEWFSSNKEVATVRSGLVTALKAGTTTITAKSKDSPSVTATCEVTVSTNQYVSISKLSFSNSSITVEKGGDAVVTVSVTPYNAKPNLTWYTTSSYFTCTPDKTNPAKCTITGVSQGSGTLYVKSNSDSSIKAYISVTVTKPKPASANDFFWGTWIRMDNGSEISVEDTQLVCGSNSYDITQESTKETLFIDGTIGNGISSFTKKSQNVIEAKEGTAVIPFYRRGGTKLDYSLKVVGNSSILGRYARAASGLSGLKVKGSSKKYKSYTPETKETDENGLVTLTAPVQGDIQTVTIDLPADDNAQIKSVVIDNLKVENSGDYMGTVALAGKDDYSLKITGTIDESEKTDGYLFAGNTYTMHLEIKNISDVEAEFSVLKITPQDNFITLSSTEKDMKNLESYSVPTINPGDKLQRDIQITVGSFTGEPYKNTQINVEIINDTGWTDFIPIRVFNNKTEITFNANEAINENAQLNGFLIYPDGNSTFFKVPQGTNKTIKVPQFKSTEEYILVFSGASVQGYLDNSTELYYTVSLSGTPKAIHDDSIDALDLRAIQVFGENGKKRGNETEDEAFAVEGDFEAYIGQGETDFYKIKFTD